MLESFYSVQSSPTAVLGLRGHLLFLCLGSCRRHFVYGQHYVPLPALSWGSWGLRLTSQVPSNHWLNPNGPHWTLNAEPSKTELARICLMIGWFMAVNLRVRGLGLVEMLGFSHCDGCLKTYLHVRFLGSAVLFQSWSYVCLSYVSRLPLCCLFYVFFLYKRIKGKNIPFCLYFHCKWGKTLTCS